MAVNTNEIFEVLKGVIDPEIGINIVDLGLVYDVRIIEKEIVVTMTLTTPGGPMHSSISEWVEKVITQLEPGAKVIVNLVWEPRWTPELMSSEAKRELGY